jgi:hypothetical protein
LVKDFLGKNNVTKLIILQHTPFFTGLAPDEYYLFLRLKSPLKGRRFCDAADAVKNAKEGLKRLLQNRFQQCFKHLYSRWQNCVVT